MTRYAPQGDTMRTALVALVVAVVTFLLLLLLDVPYAVPIAVVAGVVSCWLVGPARDRRPARSNRSS